MHLYNAIAAPAAISRSNLPTSHHGLVVGIVGSNGESAVKTENVARPPGPARVALAGLSLAVLMSSLGTSIATVALPTLTQSFAATLAEVQWVVLAYLLAATTLVVSVGRLGDIVGRRRLLVVGIALFTVASLACATAPALSWLIAARLVQGMGAATMLTLTMAFVTETVPKERVGSAIGLLGTMTAVGTALGPSIGGLLISAYSWRALFYINLPLGVAALLLALRSLPADRAEVRLNFKSFDSIGTLLLGFTLTTYALAMTAGRDQFGPANVLRLLAALIGAGAFVAAQARVNSPLVRFSMFRDIALRTRLLMTTLVAAVMMTTLVVGPFFLSHALGLEPAMVGITMSIGPIVAALIGVPAGRLVDQFGCERVTQFGLAGAIVGCIILATLPTSAGIGGYAASLSLLTAGYALFQTANNAAVMKDVSRGERGVISGLLNLSRNLGLISGAGAMGAVFAQASGAIDINASSAASVAWGMHVTFAVAAVLVLVALTLGLYSKRHSRTDMSTAVR